MLGDTIHAVASPPGEGARGVLRLSGPAAVALAAVALDQPVAARRGVLAGAVEVAGHAVPCTAIVMPGPRSYTGEDVVELHLPGSPLLLAEVQGKLDAAATAAAPVREAQPGEFTRRAFENGRLDLEAAEAVLDLVHAATDDERRRALGAVSGELGAAVQRVRDEVQAALALLESGLDFAAEETGAVPPSLWRPALDRAAQDLVQLAEQLPPAHRGGALALRGPASAGKSSLANALLGRPALLVAAERGTTRDVLRVEIAPGIELLDAPGDLGFDPDSEPESDPHRDAGGLVDAPGQALRERLLGDAAGCLLVVSAVDPVCVPARGLPVVAVVVTKIDAVADRGAALLQRLADETGAPVFGVDNLAKQGHEALRRYLAGRGAGSPSGRGARLRAALGRAGEALGRARAAAAEDVAEELVAMDLLGVLAALDEVSGRSSPEDLLDRIFGSFCLGK